MSTVNSNPIDTSDLMSWVLISSHTGARKASLVMKAQEKMQKAADLEEKDWKDQWDEHSKNVVSDKKAVEIGIGKGCGKSHQKEDVRKGSGRSSRELWSQADPGKFHFLLVSLLLTLVFFSSQQNLARVVKMPESLLAPWKGKKWEVSPHVGNLTCIIFLLAAPASTVGTMLRLVCLESPCLHVA